MLCVFPGFKHSLSPLPPAQDELHQLVAAADVDGDGRVSAWLL